MVSVLAGLALAAPAMAGDEPAAAPTDASSPAATAAPPAAAPASAPSPQASSVPAATPVAAARSLVAIVVTQPLKDAKWNREWGAMFTGGRKVNNLAEAITGQAQAMLSDMGLDSKVVGAAEKLDGARFYLTPQVKQAQQTTGVFAFSRVSDTLVVEWRVTDGAGSTQLLDTVVSTGESAIGNVFTAEGESKLRFQRLMDDFTAKSKTLLTPALTHP
jgi:hypothetical protein